MNAELDAFFEGVQAHMKANPNSSLWGLLTRNARMVQMREWLDVDSCDRIVSAASANDIVISQNGARRLSSLEDTEADRYGPPAIKNAEGETPTLISLIMFRRQNPEGGPSKDFAALVRLDEDVPCLTTFTVLDRDIPHPTTMVRMSSIAYVDSNDTWVRGRIAVKSPEVA